MSENVHGSADYVCSGVRGPAVRTSMPAVLLCFRAGLGVRRLVDDVHGNVA